ncbi:MAG: ComEC/Rec2 family competence protein [Eubacteriales bacterium]|nr:ComEC/Rec2 family competence protein [Eubacteriales bacterium]
MRRPLFGVLAGIAAAVWFALLWIPWNPPDYEPYRGTQVWLTGTVCGLEPKREGEETVWRMALADVSIEQADPGGSGDSGDPSTGISALPPGPLPGKRSRVLCVLDREPAVPVSARVRVCGTLTPFRPAYNEGEFDLRLYEHILRVEFSLREPEILAASVPSDPVAASLDQVKKYIAKILDRHFSMRNLPVLHAMLLGEKGLLEEETRTLYQDAGIIHILSISGLHLSLLGMGLFSLCGRLCIPLPVRAALSFAVIFLYGKMTGMGTSAFRAMVMLTLFMLARVRGRTYDHLTAAGIACILLLFDQPLLFLHTGFQFSFAAVLSMGILLPAMPGKGQGVLQALAIPLGTLPVYLYAYGTFPVWSLLLNLIVIPLMTVVMASAGCTVFLGVLCACLSSGLPAAVLPAPAAARIPPAVALPGTAAARIMPVAALPAPAVSLMPRIVALPAPAAARIPPVAALPAPVVSLMPRIAALPAELILDLYRLLAELSRKLPGHTVILGRPSPLQIAVYYGMLLAFSALSTHLQMPAVRRRVEAADRHLLTWKPSDLPARIAAGVCIRLRLRDNRARRRFGTLCTVLWMMAAVLLLIARKPPQFEMNVLYVGQGDGICIRSGKTTLLIDGGSTTKDELAEYTLQPFLYCKGIRRIDCAILTHDDRDHCSGLLEILEAAAEGDPPIRIGQILLPNIAEAAKGENYLRIEELADRAGIPVEYIARGMRIRAGQLTLDCLHPARGASYPDANACSTTLLLHRQARGHSFSALLTGDLEEEGEQDLLAYLETLEDAALPGIEDGILHVNLLKVAHHGSRGATSAAFLQHVRADTAVISAGINNLYGHPHAELLQRLSDSGMEVERTDCSGEITVSERGGRITVSQFSGPEPQGTE